MWSEPVISGLAVFTDEPGLSRPQSSASAEALLRASLDALLDPHVLLEAARDSSGQIVDFLYREVNQATCDYLGLSRDDLIGRGVVETMPGIRETLLPRYLRCLDTGEPIILDDFCYDNEVLHDTRRYDLRATRATATSIALTWRDVTERVQTAQRITTSERNYRLLAENAGDMVTHVRDGRFVWVSPSAESVLGAPASHWLGREAQEIIPQADRSASAARIKTLAGGGVIRQRIRVVSVDGVTHWIDLHAKPFYDDDGRQDGFTAALRLIDDQVAAEQQLEEARKQQARADERYRRSMDNAAIGMCLIAPDGRFEEVNDALCHLFGYDAETLKQKTWQELTAQEYLEADLKNVNDVLEGRIDSYRMLKQYIHADGHLIWGDLAVSCIRDEHGQVENFISQITDMTAEVEAREQLVAAYRQQARADERYRRTVDHAAVAMCLTLPDGRLHEVNDAACRLFGYDAETLKQKTWLELTPPEYLDEDLKNITALHHGRIDSFRVTKQYIHADGHLFWVDLSVSCLRDEAGRVVNDIALITDITAQVEAAERNRILAQQLQQQNELIKQQARADARYRRSMENAAIGMCLIAPEGRFEEVNDALCELFGYDAQTLMQKTWQELTAPDYLEADLQKVNDVLEGRIDSYRMVKQYIHADGHPIWGDLSVSAFATRRPGGELRRPDHRHHCPGEEPTNGIALLAQQLQQQTDRMRAELESAATYMASIMPRGLQGPVTVSSRYLPSRELGGDCFDYTWIDDDHLLVYLIDVSGHGLEPALLSVSVHNMLRSGSIALETLLMPDAVLAELNHLFQMDQQGDHYFTMWYGVYEAVHPHSPLRQRGCSAALAFNSATGTAVAVTRSCPRRRHRRDVRGHQVHVTQLCGAPRVSNSGLQRRRE